MKIFFTVFLGLIFFSLSGQIHSTIIAFGSCDNENKPQEMWPSVVRQKPELWIWGGDNIYADNGDTLNLKERYNKQKSNPGYQQLLKTCPITGTWDDHDYGTNDGGRFWPHRDAAKKMALDFLGIPKNNPVWNHNGIYNSLEIGSGKERIKIINLDTRYFRDTLIKVYYKPPKTEKKEYRYEINPTGDILGEEQWRWLENELTQSDAALNIINSSIQVIAEQHRFEKWANFPMARTRLLQLLAKVNKNVLIISGDRHMAEFSKMNVVGLPYPLYDFTSSGITHTWSMKWIEENKYRVGKLVIEKTFGLIKVNWQKKKIDITLQIRGQNDALYQQQVISFTR
ncbi:MAG: Phosphodiesterase/alkaline phosphatase D-like protein [Cytophagales bacterium]|jgi:alkaline phosphatase D|nr:alkaline phosphatase family protein [Bacteroidota bacterium]MBS1982002.1 alkaline phosphatase family protein [Bacteroidota bacterium]WHZ09455.1 MAG: Phosphodiesterase/alkaline phosphatase D-like protein [Cytophagales bacterium]